MALSGNGRYLYTLNSGDGTISSFRVGPKGELISLAVSAAEGLPSGANGLAAR
jgi:6-phosphogluconolactonase (cycloisomerase 2 family)